MSVREAEARALAEAVEGVVGRRRLGLGLGAGDVGGHSDEDEEGEALHVLAESPRSLESSLTDGWLNGTQTLLSLRAFISMERARVFPRFLTRRNSY